MLINKDQDNEHPVKMDFTDPLAGQSSFLLRHLDRVVLALRNINGTRIRFHPTRHHRLVKAAAQGTQRSRRPDGPPSKSTVTAVSADTLYHLSQGIDNVLRWETRRHYHYPLRNDEP